MNDSYACPNCGGFIEKGHPHECKRPSVSFPIDINHVQIIPFAKAMDEILTKNDYKGGSAAVDHKKHLASIIFPCWEIDESCYFKNGIQENIK